MRAQSTSLWEDAAGPRDNKILLFRFNFNINIALYFIFLYYKIIVLILNKSYLNFYKILLKGY